VQRGTGKLAVAVDPDPVDSDWPTAQCCRTCQLVIVPSYGGVADIGLSSYIPVSRRAATRAFIWDRRVRELLTTV
jgi:hypothetical protein